MNGQKETQKKCSINVIQTAMRVRLSNFSPLSLLMGLSIHTVIFFFPLNKYLFHYFPFCEKYFPQSQRAKALVTDHWLGSGAFTAAVGINLSWSPSPTPSHCRLRPLKMKTWWAYYSLQQWAGGEQKTHSMRNHRLSPEEVLDRPYSRIVHERTPRYSNWI